MSCAENMRKLLTPASRRPETWRSRAIRPRACGEIPRAQANFEIPVNARSGNVSQIQRSRTRAAEVRAFGKHVAVELSEENKRQLFIPQGFAHGFHVLSDEAIFTYKVDNPYTPSVERSIRYDDPDIQINWGIESPEEVNLSEKDMKAPWLKDADINFTF